MFIQTQNDLRVLGVDPGYDRLGLALLVGNHSKQVYEYSECFTPAKGAFDDRLVAVGAHFGKMVEQYSPDAVALETLFITKNQKTAMHVAELRGVLIYEARRRGIPVVEYGPGQVKAAVTGYGKSDKAGVSAMVQKLVRIPVRKMHDDEFDAIAVALTHLVNARHR
jgi:crossover junction endodeoxyribonuclease RuvC